MQIYGYLLLICFYLNVFFSLRLLQVVLSAPKEHLWVQIQGNSHTIHHSCHQIRRVKAQKELKAMTFTSVNIDLILSRSTNTEF